MMLNIRGVMVGTVITSREYGLKIGELRVFGSELMFVWGIDTILFRKPVVHWCFQDMSIDFLREIKGVLFSSIGKHHI